jgi:5-methylcytosine-specific restriction endonuclease McrA
MDYQEYLFSDEWRSKALEAKRKARFECALCASVGPLEVHHRTYARIGHEAPTDLIVLCEKCHRRHHGFLAADRLRIAKAGQLPLPFTPKRPVGPDLN